MLKSVKEKMRKGIEMAREAAKELNPQSRESSLILTKLDEARLWYCEWVDKCDPDRSFGKLPAED